MPIETDNPLCDALLKQARDIEERLRTETLSKEERHCLRQQTFALRLLSIDVLQFPETYPAINKKPLVG